MEIHYFQRYHSKENVDTANTLLLLSRLYTYSTDKFFKFLRNKLLPEDFDSELIFRIQEKSDFSVPDATLTQASYKIAIETKEDGNEFDKKQLYNHLSSFHHEQCKVLISLAPQNMKKKTLDEFNMSLETYNNYNKFNIIHVNLTFQNIIEDIRAVLNEQDSEMNLIIDDYENYCFSGNLIPNAWKWMRVRSVGTTYKTNMEQNLYYDNPTKNYSNHDYLGLYTKKSIRAIGKIVAVIIVEIKDDGISYSCEKGQLTEEYKFRIEIAIEDSKRYYELEKERFFIVEKFHETNYVKKSSNGLFGVKFFDLTKILDVKALPPIEKIAEMLKSKTWE